MDRAYLGFLQNTSADQIISELRVVQHLHPHLSLATALTSVSDKVGFCEGAASEAIEILGLDEQSSIGRLRSVELMQLGRVIDRVWRARGRQRQTV